MGATVGKSYTVFTIGGIPITGFILSKVGTRVVISNSISISVDSWAIISRLLVRISMVSRLVGRSWVVNRSRFVGWGRVVGRSLVVGRSRVVDRSLVRGRSLVVYTIEKGIGVGFMDR